MKVKRSAGIKRVAITLTIVLPIVCFILAAALDSYVLWGFMLNMHPRCRAIVYKVGYWIAGGFQRDKE